MPIYINIVIIFVLFFFNAIFAMYEIAMVAAKKIRLQHRVDEGVKGASVALELLKDPNQQYLSTVQIMITLIDTLAGGIGGANLALPLANQISKIPLLADYAGIISLVLIVVIITYFSIVLGELIPKRIAVSKPENIVIALSPIIFRLTKIFRPLTLLLSASTNFGLKLFRINTDKEPSITTAEIKGYIEEGRGIGLIEDAEQEMISSVLRLGARRVEALMTPRLDMGWIDINSSIEEVWQQILASSYSRIPVADGDLDQILGYIQIRDLLGHNPADPEFDLKGFIKDPIYLPGNMAALKALDAIQKSGVHLAIVLDEFGGIAGIVTDYDILESIVGEIPEDSADNDYLMFQREDGSWLFDGLIVIDQLKEILNLSAMPGEERSAYQTLSGFVMSQLGRIPKTGADFTFEGYRFEVLNMDGRRVDRVLVSRLPEETNQDNLSPQK
jgi:putative hemolysin